MVSSRGVQNGSARASVIHPAGRLSAAALLAFALLCGCGGGARSVPAAPQAARDAVHGNRALAPSASLAPIVEVQSVGTANPASASSVAATFATAPATGDLLLAGLSYYYNGGASPITAPAGWTKLSEGTHGNTGLGVYYRYAQAGDSLSWTWVSRLNNFLALGLVEYANVAPGSVPAIATDVVQANSTAPTTPSLTPSVAGSVPVGLFAINVGAVGRQTFTAGSGFTSVLSLIPPYHALGIEQGAATSTAVSATATLQSSSQVSTALVLLAPPAAPTPTPTPTPTALPTPAPGPGNLAEVQSIGSANPASTTSVAATFATAPATGDLLLAGLSYYYNGGASPITAPAGWTKLSEGTHGNTGLGVYYRYAQAGDSLSWTWVSRLNNYLALGLVEYANVAPGSVPAIATDVVQANSTAPTTPSLTPSVANSLPVGLFAMNIGAVGRQTFTAGAGFTSVLSVIPLYHALGIEQGAATSSAVSAAATLQSSSQVSTALVLLAPPAAPTPTPTPTPVPVSLADWPTYGFDNHRDGFNPNSTALTPASLGALHLGWQQIGYNSDNATQTQPVLATNVAGHAGLLFVGGQLGIVYAFDALTGTLVWQTSLGTSQYTCDGGASSRTGLGGTVAYDPASRTLYVSDNVNAAPNAAATSSIVRLDAGSGAQLGSVPIATSALAGEFNIAHSGITLANGLVYAGTGSSCDIPSWRGRIAAVSANMSGNPLTFFTTYGVGGNFSGGGVWAWGGVAVDDSGAVYAGVGNADTHQGLTGPQPPFQQTTNEQAGYGDNVIKVSSDLSTLMSSNYAGGNVGTADDLDFTGTPVLFKPVGCTDAMLAEQGKAGEMVVYDSQNLGGGPVARFRMSPTSSEPADLSNPAWSPSTGLLYVNVTSGSGGSIDPPGMIALAPSGCNSSTSFSVVWHTAFGPDSFTGTSNQPRSAPTVTAGGVVLAGTPCTFDGNGGCTATIGASFGGALWALDASSGALLNNGKPVLLTGAHIRAPAVADGEWVYVQDDIASLYGLTLDAGVKAIPGRHAAMVPRPTWYPNRRR